MCKKELVPALVGEMLVSEGRLGLEQVSTIFTQNEPRCINFTAVEGGDNSCYAGSEAREVFINTSSDISGVNK